MGQQVYITLANLKAIIRSSEVIGISVIGEVWRREIHFLNQYEKNFLIAIQHLLSNPEEYFNEIYVPHKPKDSGKFVYEGFHPAFHGDSSCARLNSNYENYVIPVEIRNRGKEEVNRFRHWFIANGHLLEGRIDLFLFRLKNEFRITDVPEHVRYENSGVAEREDLSIEELATRIDTRIKEAGRYYYASTKNQDILRMYSKNAFMGFRNDNLPWEVPGISQDEVKEFLKDYEKRFKRPLQSDLIEYYRLDLNPDIEMSGPILGRLGFKPCRTCFGEKSQLAEAALDDRISL